MKKTTLLSEQELVRGEKENDSSSRSGSPEHAGRSQLIKKVLVAAAAVAALGGAIWGIGAVSKKTQPDPPERISETTLETADPNAPRDIPALRAKIGGPMLNRYCGDYKPPVYNGSRTVQSTMVKYYSNHYSEKTVVDDRTFDLANTGMSFTEPEIRLEREAWRGPHIPWLHPEISESEPVTDAVDRAFLIGILWDTAFTPGKQTHIDTDGCVKLYIGDEVCCVYPDNTVVCDRGVGECDFLRVAALAWKYDTQSIEDIIEFIALFSRTELNEDNTYTVTRPDPSRYKLCITGPELHMDLDRETAEQLLRTVLELPLLQEPSQTVEEREIQNLVDLTPAPVDWEPPGTPICLTEYMRGESRWFFDSDNNDSTVRTRQYWFYPDGTIAVTAGLRQGRTASYQMFERETIQRLYWDESIEPQWPRPSICPNAFDWNTLIAELEKLAGQNGSDQ